MLKLSRANSKTKKLMAIPSLKKYLEGRKVYSIDLLAGWSCPAAKDCLAKVYVDNGRYLKDGPETKFRCFSASQEVAFPNVYNLRKHNLDLIKSVRGYKNIAELIIRSLPSNAGVVRFHVSGDFFKLDYLRGAILASEYRQDVLFYGYTKMFNLLTQIDMNDPSNGIVRHNLLLTGSVGSKYDSLIKSLGIRTAEVIRDESLATLPVDHDDSHAATPGGNFQLVLHGVQPKGSKAAPRI